jgi:predicted ATPase
VSGKFDQFKRSNVPYSSFISAFQQLVTTILTESAESIQYWKDKLTIVLEGRGQILVDVIPELAIIIGPQPQVPVLGAEEHATRFKNTFLSFVNVFAQKEHPLTIFLDDLQCKKDSS